MTEGVEGRSEAAVLLAKEEAGEDKDAAEDVEAGDLRGEDEPGGEDGDDSVQIEEGVSPGGAENVDRDIP